MIDQIVPERRSLGQTAIKVSPIGLGCWQFSKGAGLVGRYWPTLQQDEIKQIVQVSLAGGINWFDTAEVYGWGNSEKSLAQALKELGVNPQEAVVADKWWPLLRRANSITATIDRRLDALNGFGIDLYQIHNPFALSSLKAQMREMLALLKARKIRGVGVSNFTARAMRQCHQFLAAEGYALASNQVRYNLLDRRVESNGIMETARELKISLIAYSPLAQGLLTGKFHEEPSTITRRVGPRKYKKPFRAGGLEKSLPLIQRLRSLAGKYDGSPAQIALNWLVNFHGETVIAIPGATRVSQAQDNAGALAFKLTADELQELDQLSTPLAGRTLG
jgi:aryl-alcohol dehydrogenase-like predicted oxidoreductase